MKYLDRLNNDKDSTKAGENFLAATHAHETLNQELSKLKATKATLTAAYEATLGSAPFNLEKVFRLTDEIAINAKKIDLTSKIISEEF